MFVQCTHLLSPTLTNSNRPWTTVICVSKENLLSQQGTLICSHPFLTITIPRSSPRNNCYQFFTQINLHLSDLTHSNQDFLTKLTSIHLHWHKINHYLLTFPNTFQQWSSLSYFSLNSDQTQPPRTTSSHL